MRFVRTLVLHGVAVVAGVLATPTLARSARCPDPVDDAGGLSNAHTRYVEVALRPAVIKPGDKPFTLVERMRQYDVPGISIAVIHNGRIDWARGWGVRDTVSCAPVTPDTAFQAASISKVATAVLALRLAGRGMIGLNRNINDTLHSWKLPQDPKLAPNGVTLAQLLSHTAGLGVHGFTGYAQGTSLPTTEQILDGMPPANTPAVRSVLPAGAQFAYSGGGYVVVQLALSDVGRMPFDRLAQREVLAPLHMTHSAFAALPPPSLRGNMAFAHEKGVPIPGNYLALPELAPAGLWTTAGDLARLLADIQASAKGMQNHRLSPAMARRMLTPVKDQWGLGVALYTDDPARFGHDGVNTGFESFMISYVGRGDGIVVLTNGGQGRRLIDEVVRAVATDYGWPEIAAPATQEKTLSIAELSKANGRFVGGGLDVVFEARPDGLYANAGVPAAERLISLSPRRFRSESLGVTGEFARDFSSITFVEGGPPMRLVRVAPATVAKPTGP